jgi:molybdenum cofactor cytidylyltransferase
MSVTNKLPLGVVILGAGASSRMGKPKLLLPWSGTTIIGHLISQWQGLGVGQIAVVLRANDAALTAELERLDFPQSNQIENPQPERGMFSSIVCAANWDGWRSEISSWAIVLGDQPHLRTETLRQLLEFSAQNPAAICQPAFGGRTGHPVILPRQAFMSLKNSGAATLKDFLNLTTLPSVQCSVSDSGLSLDMDTPEDYKRLQASH